MPIFSAIWGIVMPGVAATSASASAPRVPLPLGRPRRPDDAPTPAVRKAEVDMAKTLIENLAAKFDPEKYHDRYRNELLDLLEKKAEGEPLPEPSPDTGGEVVDLMEALRQSVQATKRKRGGSGSRTSSSGKKKTASRKTSSARKKTAARKAS